MPNTQMDSYYSSFFVGMLQNSVDLRTTDESTIMAANLAFHFALLLVHFIVIDRINSTYTSFTNDNSFGLR